MDDFQPQLRAIVLPADPVPIINARVEYFPNDETDFLTAYAVPMIDPATGIPVPATTDLITQDNIRLTSQVLGRRRGLDIDAVMPLAQAVAYGVPVPFLSIIANGTTIVSVTCSQPHGLATNAQIAVQGLSTNLADGFFSIQVTTGTAFTFTTDAVIPSGSITAGHTLMVTANVGTPWNYPQIPMTGT